MLNAKELETPTRCSSETHVGEGWIQTDLHSGALLLKDSKGKFFRFSVNEPGQENSGSGTGGRRASGGLAPGIYDLVGYRIYRKDADGRPWILSVSAPSVRRFLVEDSNTTTLDIEDSVTVTSKLAANGQVQMMVSDSEVARHGATLYRNGKRIPMDFRVLGKNGKVLREGPITYG